jgi:hypothetical protein
LTNDELWQLESIIDDGVRYLFNRETSTRHYRMLYPSRAQLRGARLAQHVYKSSIGSQEGMKTRRVVERENAQELKVIDGEMRVLRKRLEKLQREFTERDLPTLPDVEDAPEEFEKQLVEMTEEMQDVTEQKALLDAAKYEILSFCIEELAMQHLIERLTQVCWEQVVEPSEPQEEGENVVESDNWGPVWNSWEEFDSDNNQIVQMLVGETQRWVFGGVPFFALQPSPLVGGIDT